MNAWIWTTVTQPKLATTTATQTKPKLATQTGRKMWSRWNERLHQNLVAYVTITILSKI